MGFLRRRALVLDFGGERLGVAKVRSMGRSTPDQHDVFPATVADAKRTSVVEALGSDRGELIAPRSPTYPTAENEGDSKGATDFFGGASPPPDADGVPNRNFRETSVSETSS